MGRRVTIDKETVSWLAYKSKTKLRNELEVGLLQSGDKKRFSIKLLPILPITFNLWLSHRMLKETPLFQPGVASSQDCT